MHKLKWTKNNRVANINLLHSLLAWPNLVQFKYLSIGLRQFPYFQRKYNGRKIEMGLHDVQSILHLFVWLEENSIVPCNLGSVLLWRVSRSLLYCFVRLAFLIENRSLTLVKEQLSALLFQLRSKSRCRYSQFRQSVHTLTNRNDT